MEQGGGQEVGIIHTRPVQAPDDIKGMALVGDRHGIEQRGRGRREEVVRRGPFGGGDLRPEMVAELSDAVGGAHRSGSGQSPHRSAAHG
jgi:hypothetical protein